MKLEGRYGKYNQLTLKLLLVKRNELCIKEKQNEIRIETEIYAFCNSFIFWQGGLA